MTHEEFKVYLLLHGYESNGNKLIWVKDKKRIHFPLPESSNVIRVFYRNVPMNSFVYPLNAKIYLEKEDDLRRI